MQQTNFTGSLEQDANTITIFIIEEVKWTILDFSQGTLKVFYCIFTLIQYQYKMTWYNTLNVKLSYSQLNELKSAIKNDTEVTLKLS